MNANQIITFKSKFEAEQAIRLSFGRLIQIGSRPFQKGDNETYESCKAIMLAADKFLRTT